MFAVKRITQTVSESVAPPGQIVFTAAGTTNWTVPAGVKSISMVAVQAHGNASATTVSVNSVIVCRAQNNSRIGDGGGNGGQGGDPYAYNYMGIWEYYGGGGGGAGGYSGNGGQGGTMYIYSPGNITMGNTAGSGGGGGGGPAYYAGWGSNGDGGGVGLLGQGANGAAGAQQSHGQAGSGGGGRLYGGGQPTGSYGSGTAGGALSYKNNVAVTPGQTVTISIGATNGAVRIIWGANRAYPSTNTGNM